MAGGNRRKKQKEENSLQHQPENFVKNKSGLPEEAVRILKSVPANKRQEVQIILESIVSQTFYSGPIPSPEMLKQFDEVYDGLAKEIVENVFSQTKHRQAQETKSLPAELALKKRGQIFGMIIAILFLGAAIYLAIEGHDTVAGVIGGSTIVSLVTVFVIGQRKAKKK